MRKRKIIALSGRTIELVHRFKHTPWFQRVGTPLGDDSVEAVGFWEQAMELCLSQDWENDCLDARNRLSMTLDRNHRTRYHDWNSIVDSVDEHLKPAMENVARQAIVENGLAEEFEWVLVRTTRMACIEAEYSDLVPPGFFTELARWYLAGHLPCGLTGKSPDVPLPESARMTDTLAMLMKMQEELFSRDKELPDPTLGGRRRLMVF